MIANKIDSISESQKIVDRSVTEKTFKFAEQHNLPFYFVSAADGTNVVKVFNEALNAALKYKQNPPDSFMNDVLEFLNETDG